MINTMKINTLLESHIQQKYENRSQWLGGLVAGDAQSKFPYRIDTSCRPKIAPIGSKPRVQNERYPTLKGIGRDDPLYLVHVPHVARKDENYESITRLCRRFRDHSFGPFPVDSRLEVVRRLALVIGVNRMKSLDSEESAQFHTYVKNVPEIEGIAVQIFGRFWIPKYQRRAEFSEKTYDPITAYRLLKSLQPVAAKKVLKQHNAQGKEVIPYQDIRDLTKNHPYSKRFVAYYQQRRPKNPLYIATMDDDIKALGKVFGHYDRILREENWPRLATTGYSAPSNEKPIYRLGIEIDMRIREAIAEAIPLAPYYPEPNLLFRLKPGEKIEEFSFVGAGSKLESRRLIQNLLAKKKLKPEQALFRSVKALETTIPARMRTAKNDGIDALPKEKLGQKSVLQALRGLSQTHLFVKQWADNMYIALPVKTQVTKVTQRLMQIFQCYDPMSIGFAFPAATQKNYSAKDFLHLLTIYERYLVLLNEVFSDEKTDAQAGQEFALLFPVATQEQRNRYKDFFEAHVRKILVAKQELLVVGLPEESIESVVAAAEGSGRAIQRTLQDWIAAN